MAAGFQPARRENREEERHGKDGVPYCGLANFGSAERLFCRGITDSFSPCPPKMQVSVKYLKENQSNPIQADAPYYESI